MRAFLPVSIEISVLRANQNRRVIFLRIAKVQGCARLQIARAFNSHRRKLRLDSRVIRGFSGESDCAQKQRARSQKQKVAKLTTRNLSFFVALVWKFLLIRRNGFAHVALVGNFIACRISVSRQNAFHRIFIQIFRIHCFYQILRPVYQSTILRSPLLEHQPELFLQKRRSRQLSLRPHRSAASDKLSFRRADCRKRGH